MARKSGSHSEITGPRIKQAALELFARHGFAAVTMRQIAANVGVQAGAIYNYTSDKQALLFDLLDGHMVDLLSKWSAELVPEDPIAALDHFVAFHLDFHIKRPELVFISYMELRNLTDLNFKAIVEKRRIYEKIIYNFLKGNDRQLLDVIAKACELPVFKVAGILLTMELKMFEDVF